MNSFEIIVIVRLQSVVVVVVVEESEIYQTLFTSKQELRSWFEVNAKFSSTTPATYMNNSCGLLYQSHLDHYTIQQCTVALRTLLELLKSNFILS